MKTIIEICSHRIMFNYFSKSKHATPNESEIEHVQGLLIENFKSGELVMTKIVKNKEVEFRGWWNIHN